VVVSVLDNVGNTTSSLVLIADTSTTTSTCTGRSGDAVDLWYSTSTGSGSAVLLASARLQVLALVV
jgi:hypothetical protein